MSPTPEQIAEAAERRAEIALTLVRVLLGRLVGSKVVSPALAEEIVSASIEALDGDQAAQVMLEDIGDDIRRHRPRR